MSDFPRFMLLAAADRGIQKAATLAGGRCIGGKPDVVLTILAAEETADAAFVGSVGQDYVCFGEPIIEAGTLGEVAIVEARTKLILGEAGSIGCNRSRSIDTLYS